MDPFFECFLFLAGPEGLDKKTLKIWNQGTSAGNNCYGVTVYISFYLNYYWYGALKLSPLFITEKRTKLGEMQPYRRYRASAGRNVESAGFVKLEYLKQQPHKTHTIDGIVRWDRLKN